MNFAITLAPATSDELPIVLQLLDEAAQWLLSCSIYQWQSPLPPTFIAFMQEEVAAGRVYLGWMGQGDPAIATFRIAHQDVPRWHDDGEDNALYVYSLAIRNDMHGLGIGAQVMNQIMHMADTQEKSWLRLDCWARNHRLQGYYKSLGFSQAGDVDDHGFPLTLFQVRLPSGNRPFR